VEAELAMCPSARSAMVYVLDDRRREELVADVVNTFAATEGVDLIATRQNGEAVVRSRHGELRFAPEGPLGDRRGASWRVEGERAALRLDVDGDRVTSDVYPDALSRLWSALECPHSGDVLVSAELGFEFVDWGGADHIGGGSHGSLHRDDSEGVLMLCGLDPPPREQWTLTDVAPLVLEHFGLPFEQ
jgi:hypothetical protein